MPVHEVWAFIAQEDDDGVLAASVMPYVGSVPLCTIHARRLPELEKVAQKVANDTGKKINLVRFARDEVAKIIKPKKKGG